MDDDAPYNPIGILALAEALKELPTGGRSLETLNINLSGEFIIGMYYLY